MIFLVTFFILMTICSKRVAKLTEDSIQIEIEHLASVADRVRSFIWKWL